jgi:hypothetical protein
MAFALVATTRGAYSARPAKPSSMMVPSDQQLAGAWPRSPEWRQVTDWARDATAADALFIIPLKLDFVAARRRDWVDWKEGAAAMWAPDIYAVWHTRTADLAALHSAPAILCRVRLAAGTRIGRHRQSDPADFRQSLVCGFSSAGLPPAGIRACAGPDARFRKRPVMRGLPPASNQRASAPRRSRSPSS